MSLLKRTNIGARRFHSLERTAFEFAFGNKAFPLYFLKIVDGTLQVSPCQVFLQNRSVWNTLNTFLVHLLSFYPGPQRLPSLLIK